MRIINEGMAVLATDCQAERAGPLQLEWEEEGCIQTLNRNAT
jgi:hypothetical protein